MAGKSTYLENAVLNWLRGTTMPTAPTTLYVALFSSDPTDASTGGTDVTSTLRVAGRLGVTGSSTFGAASGSPASISNSAIIDFGTAAAGATVSHVAIFDASTSGNKLYSGALTTPRTFATGDAVNFPISSFTLSES